MSMRSRTSKRWRLAKGILFQKTGAKGVALDAANGWYYTMNSPAARIMLSIAGAGRKGVRLEGAGPFIRELERQGIIEAVV